MAAKTKKTSKTTDVYSIHCLKNGERLYTDSLTKQEAKCFRATALFLASYLLTEYMIKE